MSRLKITRYENEGFTTFSNKIFRKNGLKGFSKYLLMMMLSLPEDWNFSVRGLETLVEEGHNSIVSALKQLEEYGYLVREQTKDEKGIFGNNDYHLYEDPSLNPLFKHKEEGRKENSEFNPCTQKPLTDNPYTDKPYTDSPSTDIGIQENIKDIKEKRQSGGGACKAQKINEWYESLKDPFVSRYEGDYDPGKLFCLYEICYEKTAIEGIGEKEQFELIIGYMDNYKRKVDMSADKTRTSSINRLVDLLVNDYAGLSERLKDREINKQVENPKTKPVPAFRQFMKRENDEYDYESLVRN